MSIGIFTRTSVVVTLSDELQQAVLKRVEVHPHACLAPIQRLRAGQCLWSPCNSSTLAGMQTGLTLPNSGETAARTFHANIVTLGFHYEF